VRLHSELSAPFQPQYTLVNEIYERLIRFPANCYWSLPFGENQARRAALPFSAQVCGASAKPAVHQGNAATLALAVRLVRAGF
jgi:hypothetical protein